jgi:hypothetical protein
MFWQDFGRAWLKITASIGRIILGVGAGMGLLYLVLYVKHH